MWLASRRFGILTTKYLTFMTHPKNSLQWLLPTLIAIFAIGLSYLCFDVQMQRGQQSELIKMLPSAELLLRSGQLKSVAFYPPGSTLLLAGWLGLGLPFHWGVINGLGLVVGSLLFFGLSSHALQSRTWGFATTVFALLNPYMFWTAMSSRDLPWVWPALIGCIWLVYSLHKGDSKLRSPLLWGLVFAMCGSWSTLLRVTGWFETWALLLFALWLVPSQRRSAVLYGSLFFALFTAAFLSFNHHKTGAWILATNSGVNLFIGNHPLYLSAHPSMDIDVYMLPVIRNLGYEKALGGALASEAFTKDAIGFITADPAGFIYRCIVKSQWHWLNLTKIPAAPVHGSLDPSYTSVSRLTTQPSGPFLMYTLYKLVYLPIFVWGLVKTLSASWKDRQKAGILTALVPMLILWPIVALTFPDTRFKALEEGLAVLMMAWALKAWWESRTRSTQ